MSGVCFWFLAVQKSKVMEQINRMGKGVKHDFAIFNALAFITGKRYDTGNICYHFICTYFMLIYVTLFCEVN